MLKKKKKKKFQSTFLKSCENVSYTSHWAFLIAIPLCKYDNNII